MRAGAKGRCPRSRAAVDVDLEIADPLQAMVVAAVYPLCQPGEGYELSRVGVAGELQRHAGLNDGLKIDVGREVGRVGAARSFSGTVDVSGGVVQENARPVPVVIGQAGKIEGGSTGALHRW